LGSLREVISIDYVNAVLDIKLNFSSAADRARLTSGASSAGYSPLRQDDTLSSRGSKEDSIDSVHRRWQNPATKSRQHQATAQEIKVILRFIRTLRD